MTLAIGIMSGTSVDAIDAALLDLSDSGNPVLLSTTSQPFPEDLRAQILDLMAPGENEIDLAGHLHVALGEAYARVALELADDPGRISVIGCHGQTVRHRPGGEHPFTLQLGSGAVIAARTGIPVVTDFRSADMALGGQGAPFAPFFHHHVFHDEGDGRAIVNLGGIANVTLLPPGRDRGITGFDSGPANGLMDLWIQRHLDQPYDRDGAWARQGQVHKGLLEEMLADPYFALSPPKSTGRELFNAEWLDRHLRESGKSIAPVDVQATLAALTARTIAQGLPTEIDVIHVCGGGAENGFLRECISNESGLPVGDTGDLGIPPQWIECAAFAWMAAATMERRACTIPSVTGASRASIAGAVYFP